MGIRSGLQWLGWQIFFITGMKPWDLYKQASNPHLQMKGVRNAEMSKRPFHYIHDDGAEGSACVQTRNQAALWLGTEKMKG
jgi:hypothetical protein